LPCNAIYNKFKFLINALYISPSKPQFMAHTTLHEIMSKRPAVAISSTVDERLTCRTFIIKLFVLIAASILVFNPSVYAQRKHDRFERREERERAEHAREHVQPTRETPDRLTRSVCRNVVRGEQNFTTVANYEKLHPPRVKRMKMENEEMGESEMEPVHGLPDPAMVRERVSAAAYGPMSGFTPPMMPLSSSPSAIFQSTADNSSSIPPDTHGAVDSNYCVTAVNGTFHIQTRSGANVSSVTLNAFWLPVLSGGGSFDPRVHYDPYANRWIIVAVSGSSSASSSVLMAVSKTSNPTGAWWMYKFDADATNTNWVDFPNVGFNSKWITVTGNMFSNTGGPYGGANVWVFDKTAAKNGSLSTYTLFSQASSFTLCPTLTYSNAVGSMFMVENYNYTVGAMRLWKITGAVGSESMNSVAFPQKSSSPWWYAPNAASGSTSADFAPQSGTTSKVQNNDHRVNQMVYMNGRLWFSHTVFLPYIAGVNPTRSAIQWWQIDTTGTPVQFGRVDDASNTNFYAFPSIAVNINNDALIGFSTFSSGIHPSAAYALRINTDATDSIRTPITYRSGQNTYYKDYGGGKNRWGDYSATALDPTNNTSFWTLQEASGTTANSWDTWWAQVNTSSCSVAAITGTMSICVGSTTTLADTTSGGTWSSSSTSIATVGASTGIVTGVVASTTTITYTVGGCTGTAVVTVNALPAAIGGTASVCAGSTTTLTDATAGGTWASGTTAVATVGTSSGVVVGIAGGTSSISYTLSTGCRVTKVVTVNSAPSAISGVAGVCAGSTLTLSDATTGGTWSSSNVTVATINATSGVVTGVAAGTTTISYTLSTGCRTTAVITVNSLPAAITGTLSACAGVGTTLADATTGGVWSSGNPAVATVASSTGVVTGVVSGTATITYMSSTGCYRTAVVTVNSTPAAITGTPSTCVGATTTLSNALVGGTWSSSLATVATVNSSTGVVTGIASGSTTITYTTSCGFTTQTVMVNTNPGAITGTASVCVGLSTTLADATTGGSWSSSSANITVGATSGVVTGVTAGIAPVTYTISAGCKATATVTINTNPAVITGTTSVCAGGTTTLSDATSGGAWTSSSAATATVSAAGVVTGVTTGSVTITYSMPTGCKAIANVTVGAAAPITGSATVCVGATTTLGDPVTGGIWSSSAAATATVGSGSGVVTGAAAGTATITYTLPGGCRATQVVTVSTLPANITGTLSVCSGSNTSLADATTGGSWFSSNSDVATVNVSNGVVTGAASGTAAITYMLPSGCYKTAMITVNALPASISGSFTVCVGATTSLSDASTPATSWVSSTTSIATISTAGVVTGVAAGTTTITYTQNTGCKTTAVVTVNPLPAVIGGTLKVCIGQTTALTDVSTGGTWSIANPSIATVDSTGGIVTGITAGTTTISYRLSTGCYKTAVFTVNALPAAIAGTASVCIGSTTTLGSTGTGTWASSNVAIATVNSSKVVTGISAGIATITFTLGTTGCYTTTDVTVNPLPAAIGGVSTVCMGNTITLTNTTAGGTWSSGNTSRATIGSADGIVAGISAGTVAITYTSGTGCRATAVVTVSAFQPIAGTLSACIGMTTTLTDATTGGTWSSSDATVATIGSSNGVVTGVASGSVMITYTISSGCFRAVSVTINSLPPSITGVMVVCAGASTSLSNSVTGGTWSSSAATIATVGSVTGVVTGIAAGTATISYQVGAGCRVTAIVTVGAQPAAIGGSASVCEGATTTLTDATTGGSWISSDNTRATITSTGIVTGVSAGTATITYLLSTGCYRTMAMLVNPGPGSIMGGSAICVGATAALSNSVSGGIWTSSTASVAVIGSSSGVATGLSAGTSIITYTASGCTAVTTIITVNAVPEAISGITSVFLGATTTLGDVAIGGIWTSGNPSVASIGLTNGVVAGVSAGTATITYMLTTGCFTATVVTVNSTAAITGTLTVCLGSTSTLSNPISGGTWTSDGEVATIDESGVVTGASTGTSVISYTYPGGGVATAVVTVNPLPSSIDGSFALCAGSSTTLSSASTGGTWSSSTVAVATIGSTNGGVNALASGTATITYMLSTGCSTTAAVTVNPVPASISGAATTFVGSTTTLSNSTSGGVWVSYNPSVATIDASGIVTGVTAGTSSIIYMLSTGCLASKTVTVNTALGGITGAGSVCVGSKITLSNTTTGGTWSSSDPSVAIINAAGAVTGITPGTSIITYTMPSGATATAGVNVNPVPSPIAGAFSICAGITTALSDATSDGSWSSSSAGIAAVDASGVVTGVAGGTAVITYILGTGCYDTATMVIGAAPGTITGNGAICPGTSITLHSSGGGAAWSSAATSIATVGSASGVVTGTGSGIAIISYILPTGCYATVLVTVNSAPSSITGATSACIGSSATLTDATDGGSWTSSNTSVATIDATTGVYMGMGLGVATITYAVGTGCTATATVAVQALPSAISGTKNVCIGNATNLSSTTTGGSWSSSDNTIASVGTSGTVAGVAEGTAIVTYSVASGCYTTAVVTVNPLPGAITGAASVCIGSTTSLASTPAGGTWSATSGGLFSLSPSTGVVTGLVSGTANITYTITTGCKTIAIVTISSQPNNITGATKACPGTTTILSDATSGGIWSSSNTSIATVGSSDGIVAGIITGTTTISYVTGVGCFKTTIVTVNPAPGVITGTPVVCVGQTTALANSMLGGTWTSSNTGIATVITTGLVTGVASGNAAITYTMSSGCIATVVVSVSALPSAIGGTLKACVGTTTALTNSVIGGAWSSANASVAVVGSSDGIATGVAAGTVRITYTSPGGCYTTSFVTVNAAPLPITGYGLVCVGTTTTLSGSSGIWSSSDVTIATAGSSNRVVTGVSAGTATISLTMSTGCFATATVTVNPVPPAITGTTTLCAGLTTTLADALSGGTWSSPNTAIATIGSLNGVITAVGQGTLTISYNFGTGCRTTTSFTVRPQPAVIGGAAYACLGSTMTLSDVTSGGTWSSSDVTVATVGTGASAGYGAVAGVSAGTVDISYTLIATGCARTKTITVNATPDAGTISGPTGVVVGSTITLASTVTGGTWVSGNASLATVGSATGIVTGVSGGAAEITYTVNNGCGAASAVYTVNVSTSRAGGSSTTDMAPGVTTTEVSVFPNPTTGKFSVNASEPGVLSVYSVEGRQVEQYNVAAGVTEVSLPQGLAAGIYMCRFNGKSGGTVMIRLVVEH
jgi:uncharacterized protein YjdB